MKDEAAARIDEGETMIGAVPVTGFRIILHPSSFILSKS
jgi:hypothetical protein